MNGARRTARCKLRLTRISPGMSTVRGLGQNHGIGALFELGHGKIPFA